LAGYIKQRPERGGREQSITASPEPAGVNQVLGELLQQHGFTYAGLARNKHEPALPLACLVGVLMQRGQLALPLDQPHSLIVPRIDG
jgi:hypothetical protein